MSKARSSILIFFTLVFVFALAGCGGVITPTPTPEPIVEEATSAPTNTPAPTPEPTVDTGYEQAMVFAGTWEGKWVNLTFNSEGPIVVDVSINPDNTMTFSMDVGGFVFGLLDPDPVVYEGTYDANGGLIEILDDPVWGNASVLFSADGKFEFIAELIPDAEIASMKIEGGFTEGKTDGNYEIEFVGGGGAEGTIELEKVSE